MSTDPLLPHIYRGIFPRSVTHCSFLLSWSVLLSLADLVLLVPLKLMAKRKCGTERGLFPSSLTKILTTVY